MDLRVAKELLHMQTWLARAAAIVAGGRDAYLSDEVRQEAGDALMMKIGEAANRLSRLGLGAPAGVDWPIAIANRNFLIHQYDGINRAMTWQTLAVDLPAWSDALDPLFASAAARVGRQDN